jgi:hypothetical protein
MLLSFIDGAVLPESGRIGLPRNGTVARSGLPAGLSEGLWFGVPPMEPPVPRRKLLRILLNKKIINKNINCLTSS